jgi:predicted transcriptional regulator/transcriptional regulator with XRE-family HTH domain
VNRAPIGSRIRRRRQELGLTQIALAAHVGISTSYLNLIEHNRRAIGGSLLHRLAEALALDNRALAGTEEARLIAELLEIAADPVFPQGWMTADDARDLVGTRPQAARALLTIYRSYREARGQAELIGERMAHAPFLAEASHQLLTLVTTIHTFSEILQDFGDLSDAQRRHFAGTLVSESERLATLAGEMFDFISGRGTRSPRPSPAEEVEDFFSDRANLFPRVERTAEAAAAALGSVPPSFDLLTAHLRDTYGVAVALRPPDGLPPTGAVFDEAASMIVVAETLPDASVRFRLAQLIGTLSCRALFDELIASGGFRTEEAMQHCRRALASYFAGALLLPYDAFREAAHSLRHDLERLQQRFGASFEQVCHRLVTLRRPGAEGLPFHFLRVDIAGNLSKRFSASGLRLPRYEGACPRWVVYTAFLTPGTIVRQLAQLPDGETYLFVARAGTKNAIGFGRPRSHRSVMIGCEARFAPDLVYGDGLMGGTNVTPVGVTCRECPREDCTQRAFDRYSLDFDQGRNDNRTGGP